MKEKSIRLSRSSVGKEEKEAIGKIIDLGYLGMGAEVDCLPNANSTEYFGGDREVLCVASGTAALHLAAAALDIGPGDEVLVPTITYVACFQAVSVTGARPIACDVREQDVFIDLADAERRLTPRLCAIMPVHYASGSNALEKRYSFREAIICGLLRMLHTLSDASEMVQNRQRRRYCVLQL